MKTLADEILEALPGAVADQPRGACAADIAKLLYCSYAEALAAAKALQADRRALFVRYAGSKQRFLVPLDGLPRGRAACGWCGLVFRRGTNQPKCCSKSCGGKLAWSKRDPEERRQLTATMVAASLASPKRKARERSPEALAVLERARAKFIADPVARAKAAAKTQAALSKPEKRRAASERRKLDWQDPAYREKLVRGHHAVIDDEYRASRSRAGKLAWSRDDGTRAAKARANVVKAREAVRGRKQSPEHIAKRVAAWRETTSNGERTKIVTRSMKERWADPEWRATTGAKIVAAARAANRGRADSEGTRARKAEAQRRRYEELGDAHPLHGRKWTPEQLAKRAATMAKNREARLAALPPTERRERERRLRNEANYRQRQAEKRAAL